MVNVSRQIAIYTHIHIKYQLSDTYVYAKQYPVTEPNSTKIYNLSTALKSMHAL